METFNQPPPELCNQYLQETADKAYRIGEIYDDLTKHGLNARGENEAIRQATTRQAAEK